MSRWADADLDFETGLYNDIAEAIVDEMEVKWNERFRPWIINVNAEYALAVEYGTAPASKAPPLNRPKKGSSDPIYSKHSPYASASLDRIRAWVGSKLGITNPEEWEKTSYLIWRKIMANGRPPSPFARPAMEDTIEAIDNGQFDFDIDAEGNTTDSRTIAEWLVDRMYYYIDTLDGQIESKRNMPTNWTGHLKNSITIDEAPPGYPTVSVNIIEEMEDEEVRDSSTLGYHAKRKGLYEE